MERHYFIEMNNVQEFSFYESKNRFENFVEFSCITVHDFSNMRKKETRIES